MEDDISIKYALWETEKMGLLVNSRQILDQFCDEMVRELHSPTSSKADTKKTYNKVIKYCRSLHGIYENDLLKAPANKVIQLMEQFMESSKIQDEYVKVKYGLLEPIELKENDVIYGYYVPPSALMHLILRSDPILQQAVLNEPNIIEVDPDGWSCNIPDLCGSQERRHYVTFSLICIYSINSSFSK